jgi:acyl-CoA synthetase (AMP-forming)/AMP-acid ligase II
VKLKNQCSVGTIYSFRAGFGERKRAHDRQMTAFPLALRRQSPGEAGLFDLVIGCENSLSDSGTGAGTATILSAVVGAIINIGGLKVHPEEIEAVINRHQASADVARQITPESHYRLYCGRRRCSSERARPRKRDSRRKRTLCDCRDLLASYKVPAVISFVETRGHVRREAR